jgi:hypothetical protein
MKIFIFITFFTYLRNYIWCLDSKREATIVYAKHNSNKFKSKYYKFIFASYILGLTNNSTSICSSHCRGDTLQKKSMMMIFTNICYVLMLTRHCPSTIPLKPNLDLWSSYNFCRSHYLFQVHLYSKCLS